MWPAAEAEIKGLTVEVGTELQSHPEQIFPSVALQT